MPIGQHCSLCFGCCYFSVTQSCLTLGNPVDYCTLGFPVLHHFTELAQTYVHWVDDAIQPSHPCRPLFLLPSVFPSISILISRLFPSGGQNYWSFSFSISPSNEYSGLVSFSIIMYIHVCEHDIPINWLIIYQVYVTSITVLLPNT